ncbi:MAG: hypothetical protein ACKO0V_00945 [bacterium]
MIALPRRNDFLLEWLCPLPVLAVILLSGMLFGGVAWWFAPLAVLGVGVSLAAGIVRIGWKRDRLFLASPLLFLALGLCAWAVVQLLPLPQAIVARLSPTSSQVYAHGQAPIKLTAETTGENQPAPAGSRIALSLNRPEGLRRLVLLASGVGVFWFFGKWTDRQSKLIVLLAIVAMLGAINSVAVGLQMLDGSPGLMGLFQPDQQLVIGPGWVDISRSPHFSTPRAIKNEQSSGVWAIHEPSATGLVGIIPGGLVSTVCLASISLPVMLGCLCFMAQRRGSRLDLLERLRDRGYQGLSLVLVLSMVISSFLLGLSGRWFAILPALAGLMIVGLFAIKADLERYFVVISLVFPALGLCAGFLPRAVWNHSREFGFERIWTDLSTFDTWLSDSLALWRFSGWTGLGLGAYSDTVAFWQHAPVHASSAPSGIMQMLIELGLPMAAALGLASLWILWRSLRTIFRTSPEHRCLMGAVLGGCVSIAMAWLLLPGWNVPILVLLSAAMAGLADRTLCGARDLFVEAWE